MDIGKLRERFIQTFGKEPQIFRAPGRVNIIGEHTDYNDGLVLPFPIEQAIYYAASKRKDNQIHIHALDLDKDIIISLDDISIQEDWTRFFVGVLRVLKEDQHQISGLNVMLNGDIPFGAGISSSSALTCGFLFAIQQLFDLPFGKKDIVFMASRAENGTGVNGGKMDQFAICMGEEDKAILLDCRDYSYQLIDSNIPGAKWFLFNTNVEHNLAETEYNDRRAECESALKTIQGRRPDVKSVRDLKMADLSENIDLISQKEYQRLSHVVNENARVIKMVEALSKGDLESVGQLLYESHQSLSSLYEVSCDELDFVVDKLQVRADCIGARMMGGGFGGSVIALLEDGAQDFDQLRAMYKAAFEIEVTPFPVISKAGVSYLKHASEDF